MSANSPQAFGGQTYKFLAWSDGGAQTHNIDATQPAAYTATFVLDTTGPVISNVTAKPGPGWATISWTTNELADRQIEYGRTEAYGSSTTWDRTLKTQHSVYISGLARKATYYFQILSRGTTGNLGTSRGSFQTK
jgi:hypothetical protein